MDNVLVCVCVFVLNVYVCVGWDKSFSSFDYLLKKKALLATILPLTDCIAPIVLVTLALEFMICFDTVLA